MNREEKLYLMIKLMIDLRGSWSHDWELRARRVKELAEELGYEKTYSLAKRYLEGGVRDGRHFRCTWKHSGGYEGAPLPELETFSKELLTEIKNLFNFPEVGLP